MRTIMQLPHRRPDETAIQSLIDRIYRASLDTAAGGPASAEEAEAAAEVDRLERQLGQLRAPPEVGRRLLTRAAGRRAAPPPGAPAGLAFVSSECVRRIAADLSPSGRLKVQSVCLAQPAAGQLEDFARRARLHRADVPPERVPRILWENRLSVPGIGEDVLVRGRPLSLQDRVEPPPAARSGPALCTAAGYLVLAPAGAADDGDLLMVGADAAHNAMLLCLIQYRAGEA